MYAYNTVNKQAPTHTHTHTAASICLTIGADGEVYVIVVHQKAGGLMSLPKGRVEEMRDPSHDTCAVRELREEVYGNIPAEMSPWPPKHVGSFFFARQQNMVTWYAVVTPDAFIPTMHDNVEVKSARWVPLREIITAQYLDKHLSFANRSFRIFQDPAVVRQLYALAYSTFNECGWYARVPNEPEAAAAAAAAAC